MKVGFKFHLEWPTKKQSSSKISHFVQAASLQNNSLRVNNAGTQFDCPNQNCWNSWHTMPPQWLECYCDWPKREDNTRAPTNSQISSHFAMKNYHHHRSHAGDQRLLLRKATGTAPSGSQFLLKWSLRESKCVGIGLVKYCWSCIEPETVHWVWRNYIFRQKIICTVWTQGIV